MKRIIVAGACMVAAAAIGTALASAFSGKSGLYGLSQPSSSASGPTTPGSTGRLFALEQEALTRQGISPAHAYRAIGVQSTIAQNGLANEIEGAMAVTYGGMWFEAATAKLHIGVTSPASRRAAETIVARAGLTADVTETQVRSTWAQILATQQQWNQKLADLLPHSQFQTALAPQTNAVLVTLSASVTAPDLTTLKREASTAHANVMVSVIPNRHFTAITEGTKTECNKFETNRAYCNKTITSGVSILNVPPNCTGGPLAIPKASKSETYLLTAGHCLVEPSRFGTKWYAYNRAGESKEIGASVPEFFDETKGDVGAIKINQSGYWVSTKANDPVFADTTEWSKNNPETSYFVTGERQPSLVGFTNCHEGQTTGQSCGVITKTGATNGITVGLIEDAEATSAGGDSGGPWLFITTKDNEALMEGVHVGKNPTTGNPVYEPLRTAFKLLTKLNLELLTTANEVRP
jgi:Trypsin